MPSYVLIPSIIAVIVLPAIIGPWLARSWRMPDHGWRIGLVLFAIFAGAAITYFGWPPKLGIDLSGGTKLIYDVEPNSASEDKTVDMDKLISAVTKRVNPQGVSEVSIRPYGPDQIEIIIPEADNREEARRIEEKISSAGTLEFRILADTRDARDDRAIELALRDQTSNEVRSATGELLAQWVPMSKEAAANFRGEPFVVRQNDRGEPEILVMKDVQDVNGDYLSSVRPGHDEYGKPAVDFGFNASGARRFGRLTSDNLPDPTNPNFKRHLGIVLDGTLFSAPSINSTITDQGQIHGMESEEKVRDLVDVLRAGALPAQLGKTPALSQTIDATLGPDTIRKGAVAMAASVLVVIVFMLVYYRFAGLIACMALVLNVLLTLAVMITIKAAFTLPGLAGLVLTVGMAVDANVLIYERIREELNRGAALRMAIRNGFDRAMTTIIDSNVTTILTAIVLYVIGSAEVKGFAITLFVGLALSMFTATFCARVVFDIAERRGWIRDLKFMQLVGETHFDFLKYAPPAIVASLIVIAIGMVAVVARGSNLLNIDFTGGTQVTLLFTEPQDIAQIREVVSENTEKLPDTSVNYVSFEGEQRGLRVELNTSQQDQQIVKDEVRRLFGDKLATQHLTVSDVAAIPADAATSPAATPPAETAPPNTQSRAVRPVDSLAAELAAVWQRRLATGRVSEALAQADAPSETQPPASDAAPADSPAAAAAESSAPAGDATTDPASATPAPPKAPNIFAGGTVAKLAFSDALNYDTLQFDLEEAFAGTPEAGLRFELYNLDADRASAGSSKNWELRIGKPREAEQLAEQPQRVTQALDKFGQQLASEPYFPSITSFGGKVARSTQEQAIVALLASLVLIVGYIWIRFQKVIFGLASVLALIHDVLVTLGALALSSYVAPYLGFALVDPFKIDLPIVAAFLTLIGFSLNDTIVIFDRIREVRGKSPEITADMINLSMNQTLSRTIITSLTVFMTVFILYVWGGQGIHGFAFALLVGVLAGTYSTIFIATPALLWLFNWQRDHASASSGGTVRRTASATR